MQARAVPPLVRELGRSDLPAAAAILSRGMRDNPLHVRVFGNDADKRQRRLAHFLGLLVAHVHANGVLLGTFVQGELVGVLGMIAPGHCQPRFSERLRFAGNLLTGAPPTTLLRMRRWLADWARNDPDAPHWHIGPLAVQPEYRRQGIGRELMMRCCARLDASASVAWLETDLEINALFYRSLGFTVARQQPVLGVPTWFMRRMPESGADPTGR